MGILKMSSLFCEHLNTNPNRSEKYNVTHVSLFKSYISL